MCMIPGLAAGVAGGGGFGSIFQLLGGVVSAIGQMQNANAQAAVYEQQAELNRKQAIEQEEASRELLEQGRTESDRRRRQQAINAGEQKAALAANGVDVEGELAIDVLDDSQTVADEDAFNIREQSRLNAEGRTQEARNLKVEANNNEVRASNARSQGMFGAFGTILSTGAKVSQSFARRY